MNSDFEKRADSILRAVERIDRARRVKKYAELRSTEPRYFGQFKVGDPIFVTLLSEEIDGMRMEDDGVIAGQLADPAQALIDVRYTTTNIPEITGRQIGLAADTTTTLPDGSKRYMTYQKCVAGDQGFAYYLPEDRVEDMFDELYAPEEKIARHPLKYARVAVRGTVLLDFLTPFDNVQID